MRVCLVVPPSPFLLDDRVLPTLGVLQVAAALEDSGHDVHVMDLSGVADYTAEIVRTADYNFDCYGVTCTTPQFRQAIDILSTLREVDPGKRVIIGGPHASMVPESCGMFDSVVLGEGEEAILAAIEPSAPKLLDYSKVEKGELKWRWPARHLINMESYKYSLVGCKATSMMWSMGCPYGCLWCGGRLLQFYRKQRQRNILDVVREVEHLADVYGVRGITAYDDEVNIQPEPLIELCDALAPMGLKLRAFIKANLFDDKQADAMARAGFVEVCTGVESGDDRILGIMEKKTSFEINLQARQIAKKHGLRFKGFCSIGHVGETYASAMETKRWIMEAAPDDFDVTVISIYPGTPIWAGREPVGVTNDGKTICKYVKRSRNRQEDGATLFFEEVDYAKEWSFYKGKPKEYVSHVWTPDLSKEDLVQLRDSIEGDARAYLGIPYPTRFSGDHLAAKDSIEHSMGQGASSQDSRVVLKGVE